MGLFCGVSAPCFSVVLFVKGRKAAW